jgi:hypothetical protein
MWLVVTKNGIDGWAANDDGVLWGREIAFPAGRAAELALAAAWPFAPAVAGAAALAG